LAIGELLCGWKGGAVRQETLPTHALVHSGTETNDKN
jgi:hypothetical protein